MSPRLDSSVTAVGAPPAFVSFALVTAASVILGVAIANEWGSAVLLVFAPIVVVLLSLGAEVSAGIVMASVSSVVYAYAYPQVAVLGVRVTWAEIALFGCVAASVLRLLRSGPGFEVRYRGDVVAFALVCVASAIGVSVSVSHGTNLKDAVMATRGVLYYFVCIPALVALGPVQSRARIIRFVTAFAIVMASLQVLQVAVGDRLHLFVTGSRSAIVGVDVATDFLRVRSPGLTVVYVVAGFALASLLWGPRKNRLASAVVFAITLAGMLVSLNRNMLIGLVAGALVAALFSRHRTRAMASLMSVALVVSVLMVLAGGIAAGGIIARIASLGDYGGLVQTTLSDRYYENGFALATLARNPIVGVGWGADYGARLSSDANSNRSLRPRGWIHNQYLGLWLRIGIAGLALAVLLLVRGVLSGLRWSRSAPPESAWMGLGLVVGLVSLSLSALAGMYFTDPDSVVPLAGLLTLGFVMRNCAPDVEDA